MASSSSSSRGGGGGLNLRSAGMEYMNKILDAISGMKALILDEDTTGLVSMVMTQSEILARDVFLTERLGADHERMVHLKAVAFVRPTRSNIQKLAAEFKDPRFGEYHLFFSNFLPGDLLQKLAEADQHEVVTQVHEFYFDYFVINRDLFTLNLNSSLQLSRPRSRWSRAEEVMFQRASSGLLSVLLSLKRKPEIRYAKGSSLATSFAKEIRAQIERQRDAFHFRQGQGCTLIIMDRRDDPVTPLLTQWTYQAMVHELLGMHNNRVDMSHTPGAKSSNRKELQDIVLTETDEFFAAHMRDNFGDLGVAVKELLQKYQKQFNTNKSIQTIEDMQTFVESYPEFKKFATNVSIHVAVMSELARLVDEHKLLDMSALEQELACASDHTNHLSELRERLQPGSSVSKIDAVRLSLLYALRYENHSSNQIRSIKSALRTKGVLDTDIALIDAMIGYAGSSQRGGDLFGDKTYGMLSKSIRSGVRAIKGVSNVYTQHNPLLCEVLDALQKGRLKESSYPIAMAGGAGKTREVVVFMLGGTTFEEAAAVAEFNKSNNAGIRVLLGGTSVQNSKSFLGELARLGAANRGGGGRFGGADALSLV